MIAIYRTPQKKEGFKTLLLYFTSFYLFGGCYRHVQVEYVVWIILNTCFWIYEIKGSEFSVPKKVTMIYSVITRVFHCGYCNLNNQKWFWDGPMNPLMIWRGRLRRKNLPVGWTWGKLRKPIYYYRIYRISMAWSGNMVMASTKLQNSFSTDLHRMHFFGEQFSMDSQARKLRLLWTER